VPESPRECRICLQTGGDTIRPCRCAGSAAFVHRRCLDRWRRANGDWSLQCQVCMHPYSVILPRPEKLTVRRRVRAAELGAVKRALVWPAAVSAAVSALALGVWAWDRDVCVAGPHQDPPYDHVGEPRALAGPLCRPVSALRHAWPPVFVSEPSYLGIAVEMAFTALGTAVNAYNVVNQKPVYLLCTTSSLAVTGATVFAMLFVGWAMEAAENVRQARERVIRQECVVVDMHAQ